MPEEQTTKMSLRAAYAFGTEHNLQREVDEIRDMEIQWDSHSSPSRRGYIISLFEKHRIFEEFKAKHWNVGNTPRGERDRRWYLRIKADYEEFLAGRGPDPTVVESPDEPEDTLEFALEAHLRDFLAKNLDRVEAGLRLHVAGERDGVEYPVEGGRIDLLAVDRASKYVVIELKLSQGRNKTLGQLLYYMGWVDQQLGNGPCRGFIIASEITDDLRVAVSRVPGVGIAQYRMSFSIEHIEQPDQRR